MSVAVDIYAELNGAPFAANDNAVTANGNYRYDGNLKRVTGTEGLYEHADLRGSPRRLTDVSGSPDEKSFYSPFGMEYGNTNPLRSIKDKDKATGLAATVAFYGYIRSPRPNIRLRLPPTKYMQARYYDPVMGRFLSIDPVGFAETGHPGMFNRYSYVLNDPINETDPTGMCPWCVVIAAVWIADKAYAAYEAKQDYNSIRSGETTLGAVAGRRGTEHAAGLALGPLGRWGAKGVNRGVDAARGAGRTLDGVPNTTPNSAGGQVVTFDGDINTADVGSAINNAMVGGADDITVLSGAHGFKDGTISPASEFFDVDAKKLGDLPGVQVKDITTMTDRQISDAVNGPGTTIGAFCNSSSCLPSPD